MTEPENMCWASALSERIEPKDAIAEVSATVREQLGGAPDLALYFVSDHFGGAYASIPEWIERQLSPGVAVGCSASGVIGRGQEVEQREAISVVAARLPNVHVSPFHCELPPDEPGVWKSMVGPVAGESPSFLLLCDPFSLDTEKMLRSLDSAYPGSPKVGGMLSGTQAPGDGAIFYDTHVLREGMVGVALSGQIEMHTLVAQGCRPVGEPMIITHCSDSVIYELNVGKPMEALQKLFDKVAPRDQELLRHSLFLGIEMNDGKSRYDQGDFLIRDVAGIEPNSGAMAVHGQCRDYQVVQFHLRDALTSTQDLDRRLGGLKRTGGLDAEGALFFSCMGRGEGLYGVANHDSDLFCRHMGAVPMGGFFGNGEIGPVGGHTFLHGYTSSLALFATPR